MATWKYDSENDEIEVTVASGGSMFVDEDTHCFNAADMRKAMSCVPETDLARVTAERDRLQREKDAMGIGCAWTSEALQSERARAEKAEAQLVAVLETCNQIERESSDTGEGSPSSARYYVRGERCAIGRIRRAAATGEEVE